MESIQKAHLQEVIAELKGLWGFLFENVPIPSDSQLTIWLVRYGDAATGNKIITDALAQTAIKFQRLHGKMDSPYVGKYASACMNRLYTEAQAATAKLTQEKGGLPATLNT